MEKWLWRYAIKREALWRLIVETKYNSLKGRLMFKEGNMTLQSESLEIYEGVGSFFLDLLDMRWDIGPRSGFGMIYGVEKVYTMMPFLCSSLDVISLISCF